MSSARSALRDHPAAALASTALRPGGVFAVWGEGFHGSDAKRLAAAGSRSNTSDPDKGNRRLVVYLATKPARG